ncbi:MAG: autotransporter outer membrane beta-barrel domain-containing protein [Gammaproteobacteria bacterium]|nr:autotransporter outer membrane beta-barrel domain-containing protein [Gammaproteobacteria bacterium]
MAFSGFCKLCQAQLKAPYNMESAGITTGCTHRRHGLRPMPGTPTGVRLLPLIFALIAAVISAPAHSTAVCSDTPDTGERIECTEGTTSTSTITIDAVDVDIDTSIAAEPGVKASHEGTADVDIGVSASSADTPSTIDTTGDRAPGVHGVHIGTGNNSVTVTDTAITTQGLESRGVYAQHAGSGDVEIDVQDTTIETTGDRSDGIDGSHRGAGAGDIEIDVQDTTIDTAGQGAYGIYSTSEGNTEPHSALIKTRRTTITTMGDDTHGIWVRNETDGGNITIDGEDDSITTNGLNAHGIYGYHVGEGKISILLRDLAITTQSTALHPNWGDTFSNGIWARHEGTGDVEVELQGGTVDTKGAYSYGVYGRLGSTTNGGTLSIETGSGNAITTTGDSGHGIVAYHYGTSEDTSLITIDVGGSIDASGSGAQGVRVGALNADGAPERVAAIGTDGYRRQTVTVDGSVSSAAEGVFLAGGGKVVIGSQGSIDSDSGVAILATGTVAAVPEDSTDPNNVIPAIPAIPPKLRVDLSLAGRRVAQVLGDNWIINDGGETTLAVNNVVLHDGATGVVADAVARNGAWNVRMREEGVTVTDRTDPDPANWTISDPALGIVLDRDFSVADFNETRIPPPPPPPPVPTVPPVPEPQVYSVENSVSTESNTGAGIHVEGDGMVHIGPTGSISAYSGIAILATQGTSGNGGTQGQSFGGGVEARSADAVSEIAPLASTDGPKLIVDMDLDGRRVEDVIGDDWIINDGGKTTIIINGVTLHEGATGVTEEVAPNGAFNVAVAGEGVLVTDRTDPDPANWTISDPALGITADRDFSAKDFLYLPASGGAPVFVEEYAPRAAVYEALPGFLLRLGDPGPFTRRALSPDSPVWVRVSAGKGSYEAERVSVGAEYDYDHHSMEAGKDISLGEHATGSAFIRHVSGSADVSSPTKGGKIDAEGIGLALGLSVDGPSAYYVAGGFSFTRYDMDLSSDELGRLKTDVGAYVQSLDLEVGRRMTTGGGVTLAPRVRLMHSEVDMEKFTDAVDARVSGIDATRITASLGVAAETVQARNWWGGAVSLRGSVDLAHTLGGMETRIDVSGEELSSKPIRTRLLLDLGGTYRRGRTSLGAEITAGGLGSDDEHYAGRVTLGRHF